MKKGKDISTEYTKELNEKCGRRGYCGYKREVEKVISPKEYGMFLAKNRREGKHMKVINKKIRSLKPYKNNAKKHPKDQIEKIAESIKEFGFTQPVLIDENNVVVAGHGRILGAKMAGLTEVPTVCLNELTEDQIKAYRLIDNKLNESDWNFDLIELELRELNLLKSDIDMNLFGFDSVMSDSEIENEMEREVKFRTKEKHLVIVPCKDEKETIQVQREIEHLGYKCDVKNT